MKDLFAIFDASDWVMFLSIYQFLYSWDIISNADIHRIKNQIFSNEYEQKTIKYDAVNLVHLIYKTTG